MKAKYILGFDIGGANTKAALLQIENDSIHRSFSYIEYFPFWEKALQDISSMFVRVVEKLMIQNNLVLNDITFISITITAELSDAFQTKREGILTIVNALGQIFEKEKLFFINNKNEFYSYDQVKLDAISVAGANWVSTSLFLGNFVPKCILIDAGSTTIDVIPILNSVPVPKGKNDVERLINRELIYTGGLRATIPSIAHFLPYKDKMVRISFERFALVSDIHRILNNISEADYINDTADNRSKTLNNCYARLARMLCMDLESISIKELDKIAKYIYDKQIEMISNDVKEFMSNLNQRLPEYDQDSIFVITGLSAGFLIENVLIKLGYDNIKSYEQITGIPDQISSSAYAVAGAFYLQL